MLELKDIRTTIKDFDTDEWHTMPVSDSLGRYQETNMLTEQGLYKLLFISRKPIAKKFQKWVYKILKEVRLTGEYRNKKLIENESKSQTLVNNYLNKSIAYIGVVREIMNKENSEESYTIVKYGITRCVEDALDRHRKTYGPQFYFVYMTECAYKDVLERKIQTHNDLISRHVKNLDGKDYKELLRLDKNFTIDKLIELIKSLKESMESKYDKEIELAKELTKQKELDLKQKELDNERYREETQLELKKIELEMRRLELQYQHYSITTNTNNNIHNTNNMNTHNTNTNIIKEYYNTYTVYSNNRNDAIKMSDLYHTFSEWLKENHSNIFITQRDFTNIFKRSNIGKWENKISSLNGNSGIRHRKFTIS